MASSPALQKWPPGVAKDLRHYVYRLVDPRNGETFYVGKGKGDRVFAHARAELTAPEAAADDVKLGRIHRIRNAGLEVGHVIHRHGMDDQTARVVEAALIDAYPGLTNRASPPDGDLGVMHAEEIVRLYRAKPATFKHRALLINVNQSGLDTDLLAATSYAWKLGKKAKDAEVVLATWRGMIVGAFIPDEWLEATHENFPTREPAPGRLAFKGHVAPPAIEKQYVGKRVPDKYRKPGASNPVRYTW